MQAINSIVRNATYSAIRIVQFNPLQSHPLFNAHNAGYNTLSTNVNRKHLNVHIYQGAIFWQRQQKTENIKQKKPKPDLNLRSVYAGGAIITMKANYPAIKLLCLLYYYIYYQVFLHITELCPQREYYISLYLAIAIFKRCPWHIV